MPSKLLEAGQPISASRVNREWAVLQAMLGRGAGANAIVDSRGVYGRDTRVFPVALALVEIITLQNDYLEVQHVDAAGNTYGEEFNAAKPEEMRHDPTYYPLLGMSGSITTTDTNQVSASKGTTTETWKIAPRYYTAGDLLIVASVPYSGVTVSSKDLKWMDLNIGGRAWSYE